MYLTCIGSVNNKQKLQNSVVNLPKFQIKHEVSLLITRMRAIFLSMNYELVVEFTC